MTERFEKLYGDHVRTIYLYCLKRVRDESVAEDLASEVFVRLYTHIGSVRAGEEVQWLCTVANHLCIDYWRKAATEKGTMEKMQVDTPAHAPTAEPPIASLDELLNRCDRLNQVHRQCIEYRYVLGMSLEEIAERVGKTAVQVKGYLQYARKIMREALQ